MFLMRRVSVARKFFSRSQRLFSAGGSSAMGGDLSAGSAIGENPFGNNLPGMYGFDNFYEQKCIFIDKTLLIHELLLKFDSYVCICRPRRMGKSVLLQTIEAIGNMHESIKLLKIGKNPEIYNNLKKHPSLAFDFSNLGNKSLNDYIVYRLTRYANNLNLRPLSSNYAELLNEILEYYKSIGQRPYILIDEYDYPIWTNNALENLETLRSFLTCLKAQKDFTSLQLLTGIARIDYLGIGSGANHITDETLNPLFSTIVGFTEDELRLYFQQHLKDFALKLNLKNIEEAISNLRDYYNGYSFSEDVKNTVYNPISVIKSLRNGKLRAYWLETGSAFTPKLKKMYEKLNPMMTDFNSLSVADNPSDITITIEESSAASVLWQYGYLTIDKFQDETYQLRIPNKEIKEFFGNVKSNFLTKHKKIQELVANIENYFVELDFDNFSKCLYQYISTVCESYSIKNEKDLEIIIKNMFGFTKSAIEIRTQQNSGKGIADIIIVYKTRVYIIELEVNRLAKIAYDQILTKEYYSQPSLNYSEFVFIGINYSKEKRNIDQIMYDIKQKGEKINLVGKLIEFQ